MRPRRFQVTDLSGPLVHVEGAEAIHALRVLRLGPSSPVILFDGLGNEVDGRIASVAEGAFNVELTGGVRNAKVNQIDLILAVATPKGDRADWLVEKCAELGVAAVQWIETERSVVSPGENKLVRWRRKAAEAAKQGGRSRVMDIASPVSISRVVQEYSASSRLAFGDPSGEAISIGDYLTVATDAERQSADTVVFIGPEGGFTAEESRLLIESGAAPIRLADAVLRIETAAVAVASVYACMMARRDR